MANSSNPDATNIPSGSGGNQTPTPSPNIGLSTGKKHSMEPGEAILTLTSKKGYEKLYCFFLIDQPLWIVPSAKDNSDPYNHKDNDKIVLKDSGHLNTSLTKLDDLKNWCLRFIDSSKYFKSKYNIRMWGYASYEGKPIHNMELSRRRLYAIKNWIESKFPDGDIAWIIKERGNKDANEKANTEKQRQWDRRVDISMENFQYLIKISATIAKSGVSGKYPKVEWSINGERLIWVQKEEDNPDKVTMSFLKRTFEFEKIPAALFDYSLKLINENQDKWKGKVDREMDTLKQFFEEKQKLRMSTSV